jgi:2-dehydro-3-deoxygluconokinase
VSGQPWAVRTVETRRSRTAGRVTLIGSTSSRSVELVGCILGAFLPRSLARPLRWLKPPFKPRAQSGTVISYDLNYRESLWKGIGGKAKAQEVNRELVSSVDVLFGNEEDFSATLGIAIEGVGDDFSHLPVASYEVMLRRVAKLYPNLKVIATSLRTAHSATMNDWGAIALHEGKILHVPQRPLEILDRVGGGDSFASGLIYGLLTGKDPTWSVQCGVAHGALAMTTPGDTSMVTLPEVEAVMRGGAARIAR